MQMKYVFEVRGWLTDRHSFDKRWFNKVMKEEMKALGEHWHKKYFPKHFTRQAYPLYGGDYHMKRKKRGRPLVVRGRLRGRVLQRQTVRITSTSKRVTVYIPFGNPAGKTKEDLDKETFIIMRKQGVGFKTARRMVSRANAYSAGVQEQFKSAMTSVHPGEEREMAAWLVERLEKRIKERQREKAARRRKAR